MERHFGLPLAFAAALHGAVLFGVSKSPRPILVKVPVEDRHLFPVNLPRPVEDKPEPVDVVAGGPPPRPDVPVPVSQPERPAVAVVGDFTIAPPPISANVGVDLTRVPLVPALPGGDGRNLFSDVIGHALLDNTPRTRFQTAPAYPYSAKKEGLGGTVMVEFVVNEQGEVVAPRVVSSTHAVFDEASLRAVAKWRFEPGRRGGRVVPFRMTVPVVFTLQD